MAGFLKEAGIPVVDADDVCHDLMRSGRPGHGRIVEVFGSDVLAADGEIDRRQLGRIVFESPALKMDLESILHPAADRAIEEWIAGFSGTPWLAAVIPLVYEKGWESRWDSIVCVAAPLRLQLERLVARGLSQKEADARVSAQIPVEAKMRRADRVIFNAGSRDLTREQTKKLMEQFSEQWEKANGR